MPDAGRGAALTALNRPRSSSRSTSDAPRPNGRGRPIVGPGLPLFRDDDGRFFSDDCLRMPGPEGTPVDKGKSTAEMECVGHTDLTEDDILDLEERREIDAAIDDEIEADDY